MKNGNQSKAQLVPLPYGQCFDLDADDCELLVDTITADPDQITTIGLRIGHIKDDEGNIQHGLCFYETEHPDEGAILLVELPEPRPNPDLQELSKELENLRQCARKRTFKECEYWLNQYKLFCEKLIAALERHQVQS